MKKHGLIRRAAVMMLTAALCLPMLSGCSGLSRYEASFIDAFDTVTKLALYAPSEAAAQETVDNAHELLLYYHSVYDIYNDYEGVNGVYKVNAGAGGPVEADAALIDLLEYAKTMYYETGGKMNVAMGAVLSIWHEYREAGIEDPANAALPPMEALLEASKHTDIDKLIIDREAGTVCLEDEKMSLDLGAIAKGYAAQLVADALEGSGVSSLLLSVGGNVCAIGARADGKDWKVSVQSPFDDSSLCTVNVNGLTLVTSGTYQRYYTVGGAEYHHIIDPETLMPARYFESVSILCSDSGLADALSTALFNMPLDEGMALALRFGAEVCWVEYDGTVTMTDGFESAVIKD